MDTTAITGPLIYRGGAQINFMVHLGTVMIHLRGVLMDRIIGPLNPSGETAYLSFFLWFLYRIDCCFYGTGGSAASKDTELYYRVCRSYFENGS